MSLHMNTRGSSHVVRGGESSQLLNLGWQQLAARIKASLATTVKVNSLAYNGKISEGTTGFFPM